MQTHSIFIETQREYLRIRIQSSSLSAGTKEALISRLALVDVTMVETLCLAATKPLSSTNLRYVLCFLIHMEVNEIAVLFNVDPGSVYSIRYRLRKAFNNPSILPF